MKKNKKVSSAQITEYLQQFHVVFPKSELKLPKSIKFSDKRSMQYVLNQKEKIKKDFLEYKNQNFQEEVLTRINPEHFQFKPKKQREFRYHINIPQDRFLVIKERRKF